VVYEDKSAASFCHQVAAWVPVIFCNFYLLKNHKFANKTTTKARGKSTNLESLEIYLKNVIACLTKFNNNQILLNKISSKFLMATNLFTM
jgi:hypothetical protein